MTFLIHEDKQTQPYPLEDGEFLERVRFLIEWSSRDHDVEMSAKTEGIYP